MINPVGEVPVVDLGTYEKTLKKNVNYLLWTGNYKLIGENRDDWKRKFGESRARFKL